MNRIDIEKGVRPVAGMEDLPVDALRELLSRWSEHAQDRLPHPDVYDPVDFPQQARFWTWVDVVDGGEDFHLRFVGPEIVHFLQGVEITGVRLSEYGAIVGEEAAQLCWNLTCLALRERAPAVIGPMRPPVEDRAWMKVTIMALPCASDGHEIDRILLANHFDA